jgi:hemolysin III
MVKYATDLIKPLLRGHFHQAAFFTALGAGAMLIGQSHGLVPRIASMVFALSLAAQFGISALYHRPDWNESKRFLFRQLDHSAIFILIAGTFTPICLIPLRNDGGLTLLAIVWSAALIGVLQCLFWSHAPRWIISIYYVVMGWLALPYVVELNNALGVTGISFLVVGGVAYTVGAVIYVLKRPNPWPKVFGYHEIFHSLTIVAAICHFLVIQSIIN